MSFLGSHGVLCRPQAPYPGGYSNLILQYFYHPADLLCLMTSFFCVSQATIVAIFGPSMALTAQSPEAMMEAVTHMQEQQTFVLKVGLLAVTSLFVSTALLTWANPMPPISSAVCTLVLMGVYYAMVVEGRKAYNLLQVASKKGHIVPTSLN